MAPEFAADARSSRSTRCNWLWQAADGSADEVATFRADGRWKVLGFGGFGTEASTIRKRCGVSRAYPPRVAGQRGIATKPFVPQLASQEDAEALRRSPAPATGAGGVARQSVKPGSPIR